MRTVHDVIDDVDGDEQRGLSSYGQLAPVYDFINADHFNYDRQEQLAMDISTGTQTFIELGCGSGRLLERLDGQFETLVGVDMSAVMLSRAAERTQNAALVQGDVRTPVLQNLTPNGVAMVGRVFSKLRTDKDVQAFANATASWLSTDTELVFNTFRRQDLVDGMEKVQRWERGDTRVVRRSSTTLLEEQRPGLMEIEMEYDLTNTRTETTVTVAETFTLRGYDRKHVEACFDATPLEVTNVRPNPDRSTQFVFVQHET